MADAGERGERGGGYRQPYGSHGEPVDLRAVGERLVRLETLVENRLLDILRRLDAINGSVARTSQRMDEHERSHRDRDERLARWQGEIGERLAGERHSGEVARWRTTLIATLVVSVVNLIVQVLIRLFSLR